VQIRYQDQEDQAKQETQTLNQLKQTLCFCLKPKRKPAEQFCWRDNDYPSEFSRPSEPDEEEQMMVQLTQAENGPVDLPSNRLAVPPDRGEAAIQEVQPESSQPEEPADQRSVDPVSP